MAVKLAELAQVYDPNASKNARSNIIKKLGGKSEIDRAEFRDIIEEVLANCIDIGISTQCLRQWYRGKYDPSHRSMVKVFSAWEKFKRGNC
jgi:hypothetical protein